MMKATIRHKTLTALPIQVLVESIRVRILLTVFTPPSNREGEVSLRPEEFDMKADSDQLSAIAPDTLHLSSTQSRWGLVY
jgi:hypothetical protein